MKYISERNMDFIDDTGLIKVFQLNDEFLRPYMVSTCMYDIMMASIGTTTPLRYEVNYRNYFLVTQGSIKILLIPPKDTRYLYPINDYDILEFRSPVNPWKVQPEYQDDFDKIKTLEVELFQGMVMFIPAYWWYSIQFNSHESSVCSFKYRTHMNTLAIAPQLTMNVLQNMNIKRDTLEKRTSVKNPFHESSFSADCDTSTTPTTIAAAAAAIPEYTPSVDEQYLPKSLRGPNNNPYSIMNTMTESILSSSAQQQEPQPQQQPPTDINAMELETSVAAAAAAAAAPVLAVSASETIIEPQ
jgi:hypothetical protein